MTKIKLTRKQHNKLFPKIILEWYKRANYTVDENDALIITYKVRLIFKILFTLVFPVVLLIGGIVNFRQYINDMRNMWNDAIFSRDKVCNWSEYNNKGGM